MFHHSYLISPISASFPFLQVRDTLNLHVSLQTVHQMKRVALAAVAAPFLIYNV